MFDLMRRFSGILTLFAAAMVIGLVVLEVIGRRSASARSLSGQFFDAAPWLAFAVAGWATFASLWFSGPGNLTPCKLCWYQRICMYPLSVVLLVGAQRRDRGVRWYVAPLAAIGLVISVYHSLLEWEIVTEVGSCDPSNPCSSAPFREFGTLSLANMAAIGFVAILALLFLPRPLETDDHG